MTLRIEEPGNSNLKNPKPIYVKIAQAKAWKRVTGVIERFKSADWYLFSLPMWNFGVPYVLKHLIDVIVQPGLTFSFSPTEGYKGLVTGKKAVAVYARGGAYGSGSLT